MGKTFIVEVEDESLTAEKFSDSILIGGLVEEPIYVKEKKDEKTINTVIPICPNCGGSVNDIGREDFREIGSFALFECHNCWKDFKCKINFTTCKI